MIVVNDMTDEVCLVMVDLMYTSMMNEYLPVKKKPSVNVVGVFLPMKIDMLNSLIYVIDGENLMDFSSRLL
jgi:hypothetical protein